MGVPAFRAASAKAAAAQDATPALPAGMSAGDIVILVATCPTANTISISANGSIAAWTAITGTPVTVTGGEVLYVWWGRYVSGSTGPTVHASASDVILAATAAWSGCLDVGSPIDTQATGTETTSDTSFSFATGISSTRNNCLAICVASILRDSNTASVPVMANTSLTSLASRLDVCTNTGAGSGFGLSEGAKATAGTLGTWTNTYGAASAKSYVTFALIGGKSGVVSATSLSVTDAVAGGVAHFGAVASALTVSDAVVGTRKTFGAAATAASVSDTVAGSVSKTGAAATALAVTDAVVGTRTTFAAVAVASSVSDTVSGTRNTFSVADPTALTVTQAVAGNRVVAGLVTATDLTIGTSVTGSVDHFGAADLAVDVAQAVAGSRTAFGAASTPLTVDDTVAGDVTHTGAAAVVVAVTQAVVGHRATFATVATALTVTQSVDGFVGDGEAADVFGVVEPTELFCQHTVTGTRTEHTPVVRRGGVIISRPRRKPKTGQGQWALGDPSIGLRGVLTQQRPPRVVAYARAFSVPHGAGRGQIVSRRVPRMAARGALVLKRATSEPTIAHVDRWPCRLRQAAHEEQWLMNLLDTEAA